MDELLQNYADRITHSRVYDVARKTPLERAHSLSVRMNNEVYLKREDLQSVFSFKLRGAYNKISGLTEAERQQGVIAASAGNHAQGVALAAQRMGIKSLIVMPKTTPRIKVDAVRSRGSEVVLHGNAYDDAYTHAQQLVKERNYIFIPPYDDEDVIAGQGTVALEILEQSEQAIDAIFVPVGGGGLIAGIATYVKYKSPNTRIIGVEPDESPCMANALKYGERIILDHVGIFADGVAVRQVGEEPFRIASAYVDEMIVVTTDEVCAAIKDIFDDTRTIAEPAGALSVAGLKKYVKANKHAQQNYVAIISGANINFDRLRHVAERAEIGEQREALIAATIPEVPGSFLKFCGQLGHRGITEFNYRYSDSNEAHVFAGVQLEHGESEKNQLIENLIEHGYPVVDMTENEMAKIHIRYMVGGRTHLVDDERVIRFEFPERPGALLRFLKHIAGRWNISLFHYRNHGAAYGRVLVGIQVPAEEYNNFQTFLDGLGYAYFEETDNPAYHLFLR